VVALTKAIEHNHRSDGGGARADDLARRTDHPLATTKPFYGEEPIRAEIVGADRCHAAGVAVRGAAPVLVLCRTLIAAGLDPGRALLAFRGNVLSLRIRSIGEAAQFVVDERRMTLARWRPFSCAEVPSRIALRKVAAMPLPGKP
jgi:hypothetical protein